MKKELILEHLNRLGAVYPNKIPLPVIAETLLVSIDEAKQIVYDLEKEGYISVTETTREPARFVQDKEIIPMRRIKQIMPRKPETVVEYLVPEVPEENLAKEPKRFLTLEEPKPTPEPEPLPTPEPELVGTLGSIPYPVNSKLTFPDPKPVEKHKVDWDIISISIIRILMGIVGFGASAMSCYYTTFWLLEFLPGFLAFFLSFLMIIFAVLSVQVTLILAKLHSRAKFVLIPMFAILWIVVTTFSMGSTVAGQYNIKAQNQVQIIQSNDTVQVDTIQLQLIQDDISLLEDELKARQLDRDNMLKRMENVEQDNDEYNALWNRMNAINGRINQISTDLRSLRSKYADQVNVRASVYTSVELQTVKDFYEWLGGILSVNRDQVQFWTSIFPAIFIDLIAPIGVAIALFLQTTTKEKSV